MSGESSLVLDLLPRFVQEPGQRQELLDELDLETRQLLLGELMAHYDVHRAQGHRGPAHRMLELGAQVADGFPELEYKLERRKITWLESQGLTGRAIEAMTNLFERFRRSRKHPYRGAELAMELGILLDRSGRKEEALKHFRSAIGRYKRLGHQHNLAAAWFNVASVLYDLKRVNHSINACEKALDLGGRGRAALETPISLQMANSLEQLKDTEKAFDSYKKAAEGYAEMGNRRQESNILFRLGWMSVKSGRDVPARRFLERALELKREHDYGTGLALYHIHLAETCARLGVPGKTSNHLRHALALAAAVGNDAISKRARFGLFRLALEDGRPLSEYLAARPPKRPESALAKASAGVYSDHGRDGFRTSVWRETPEPPLKDRKFLSSLLKELLAVRRRLLGDDQDYRKLRRQSRAVDSWRSRRGRNRH